LKKIMNCTINDFEYLIFRGRSLYGEAGGGKNRAAAFLFPYLEAVDSEIERDDRIAHVADAFLLETEAVRKDYSKWKGKGHWRNVPQEERTGASDQPIRMNAELFLLTVVAVNMTLYPEFRAALEIKEIDDPAAKELFVAMEECFVHDENDIDSLLARISGQQLKNFIASRGASQEFRGDGDRDPHRLMEDGINEIRKKRLRKRLLEIGAEMRNSERNQDGAVDIDELLAEKKFIDSQIRKLEGR